MIKMLSNLLVYYRNYILVGGSSVAQLEVNAVYDEDMEKFLASIDMLDSVLSGNVVCSACSTKITLDNILSVYPENNEIKVCCTNWTCYHNIVNKGGG